MAVHGDINEINVKHSKFGSFTFFPKAAEGNTFYPGGLRNSDDSNGLAGNGALMITKNRTVGFFEVVVENNMVEKTAEFAAKLAADILEGDWTFSLVNGSVFVGKGVIVGDIQPDTNAGTFTLKVNSVGFVNIT